VLLIGRGGLAARLRNLLKRRGHRVRVAPDCGAALESMRGDTPAAVVLDVAGAGFGAAAFREMLKAEHARLPLLEVAEGDGLRPEDLGLLVASFEKAIDLHRQEQAAGPPEGGAEALDAEPAPDTPLTGYKFEDLTSSNPRMLELFELIPRVARTDSPVLIHGETGTGKELVAAAIHRQSRRRDGPFFTVNCGALTDGLLESELFGHEKGAFTGAYRRKEGYFELASGGTLFLDELGTISPAMQVKLLRVLERMEVRRVGGGDLTKVDVRVVSATNARLEDSVAAGTFREDLYYRINVVQLVLPPLRDRPEDVPLLADLFRRKFAERQGREVTAIDRAARRLLVEYPWPGNVRELQNVVERAVIMATGSTIQEKDLPERLRRGAQRKAALPSFDAEEPLEAVLERIEGAVEREYLKRVLRKYHGHLGRCAEHAGLNRRTLYNKLRAHGLRREDFK
jgi:DNA-binding NtrC family response regulator